MTVFKWLLLMKTNPQKYFWIKSKCDGSKSLEWLFWAEKL